MMISAKMTRKPYIKTPLLKVSSAEIENWVNVSHHIEIIELPNHIEPLWIKFHSEPALANSDGLSFKKITVESSWSIWLLITIRRHQFGIMFWIEVNTSMRSG